MSRYPLRIMSVGPRQGPAGMAVFRRVIEGEDFAAANDLVVGSWSALLDEHAADVRAALTAIPTERLVQYPLLGLLLGFSCARDADAQPRAARYLALASRATLARLRHADVPERIALHVAESAALRQLGDARGAISAARAAVRLLGVATDDHLAAVDQLPRLYADLGWTFFEDGRSEEALVAFLRGLAGTGQGVPSTGSLAAICAMQALEGDIAAARDNIELAHAGASGRGTAPRISLHLSLGEALVHLERFAAPKAAQILTALGDVRDTTDVWIELARIEAAAALVAGRAAEGLAALDAVMRRRAPEGRGRYAQRRLAPIRALLQLALGNVEAARAQLAEHDGATPQIRVGQARVDLARGRVNAALRGAAGLAAQELSPRTVAEAAAIEAAVLLRLPTATRVHGAVDRLGSLVCSTGLRLPLALLPLGDYERVRHALTERGYGDLYTDARPLLPDYCGEALTSREIALLRALAEPDASRSAIASRLHVSVNTVKTQLRMLYRKLGVSDRETALATAHERHLLHEDDEPAG